MKKTVLWILIGFCVAPMICVKTIAQDPYTDTITNIINNNYETDRQFDRMREGYGTVKLEPKPSRNSRNSRLPDSSNQVSTIVRLSSSPIAPRILAANSPETRRATMEALYSTLLKSYPATARGLGIRADNDFANVAAAYVCSNMQAITQRRVPPANCQIVSRQMRRAFATPKFAAADMTGKQADIEILMIKTTLMQYLIREAQKQPNSQQQANLAARGSSNIQKLLNVPGNQLQITERGLSKKQSQ